MFVILCACMLGRPRFGATVLAGSFSERRQRSCDKSLGDIFQLGFKVLVSLTGLSTAWEAPIFGSVACRQNEFERSR